MQQYERQTENYHIVALFNSLLWQKQKLGKC